MRPAARPLLAATAALSLALTGCGSASDEAAATGPTAGGSATEASGSGPLVVVTTTILGDIVRGIAQSDAQVEVLMDPGQDAHGYSPSAQDAARLREADLVIANGLQLTDALIDPLEAAEEDGVEVLRVAERLDPIAYVGGHAGEGEGTEAEHADGDGHDHGPLDPHVWLDPVRMADAAPMIAEHLAEVDDALDDEEWSTRGQAVADEILVTHDEIEQALSDVSDGCRRLVTNHEALGYFAARYDFEVIGTILPGTTSQLDPNARDFAELAETLRDNDVSAIFGETSASTRLAESLAAEVGRDIEVVELYTESVGEPGSGAETYTTMMVANAERIADALASC